MQRMHQSSTPVPGRLRKYPGRVNIITVFSSPLRAVFHFVVLLVATTPYSLQIYTHVSYIIDCPQFCISL